ncbi:hypothetical protein Purlil1_1086 [Purpureocillium lilacinum]|uniref:Uncharacterized protein n=1 Tax=Purpureocillium lilacinum TaxID=33203 RepID=A0ABR0CDH9_PURLI|nr:hypothetical protein Purlil1_1086 [Purpureocillium lilacinum]
MLVDERAMRPLAGAGAGAAGTGWRRVVGTARKLVARLIPLAAAANVGAPSQRRRRLQRVDEGMSGPRLAGWPGGPPPPWPGGCARVLGRSGGRWTMHGWLAGWMDEWAMMDVWADGWTTEGKGERDQPLIDPASQDVMPGQGGKAGGVSSFGSGGVDWMGQALLDEGGGENRQMAVQQACLSSLPSATASSSWPS